MRTIENRPLNWTREVLGQIPGQKKISVLQEAVSTDYFTTLVDILQNPPEGGWKTDPESMDKYGLRVKIMKDLKKTKKTIDIEEKEYDEIMTAYSHWKWGVPDEDILAFHTYIKGVPQKKGKTA